jgi:hypothetical protein
MADRSAPDRRRALNAAARATLRAEATAAVARHGAETLSDALDRSTNPVAAAVAGELAKAENLEIGPNGTTRHGPPGLRIVQAANDDTPPAPAPELCRCPACEGTDGRGEGDA